ncbi:MAG: S9 family peptidase, partial [Gemmatimonadota bacterium]
RHPVSTVRHGETFVDDYAWLRDRESPEVRTYLEAENTAAEALLAPLQPLAEILYHEMLGRIVETDLSVPYEWNGWWYYARTEEGLQYPIHCRRAGSMAGPESVLLDPNEMGRGHPYIAIGSFGISDDGWRLAYSVDLTGFRQYTLHVIDLRTREPLITPQERVTSVAWDAGTDRLWYTTEDTTTKRSDLLHRFDIAADATSQVWHEADETMNIGVSRSRSREWLVLDSGSHTTSEAQVRRAGATDASWRVVLPRVSGCEYDLAHHDAHFYLRINDQGRNFRLVRISTADGTLDSAEEVLSHRDTVMLEAVESFAGHLVRHEREDGLPHLAIHPLDGATAPYRIAFSDAVYECYSGANPSYDTTHYRFGYQSPVEPMSVWSYDVASRDRVLLKQQPVKGGYDASRFTTRRLHATAPDGTRVPISVVHRADLQMDGTAPVLLHAYGSYGYPYPTTFSSNQLSLLERGVVVAIGHIRGGGELGKAWHDQGRLAHKVNTFRDFIACADALVAERIADPDRLAIEGGSAGGLLMGAVVNSQPERFAAVLSQVPFVDVINTMSDASLPLTVGEYEEWGNPAVEEEFGWMRAYCPYTNLVAGPYPPMLVRTSLNDSQVMYWEPAKYVARIRAIRTDDAPLLLLTNMGAGHGGASGRYDRLREISVDYAFVLSCLGVPGAPLLNAQP